jgi:Glycosyl transferases group 1
MKILFMMDTRVNAGSIQAVANYMCAGDELGHSFALYGHLDPHFPCVRFSTELSSFDYVVLIIESGLNWLSGLRILRLLSSVPRRQRAILDADGMYNQVITIDGYDRNHTTEHDRLAWLAYYSHLADKVLQPTVEPRELGVRALPFYGYNPASEITPSASPPKRFDILHVGHNWWRWREVANYLLPAIERIRTLVGDIGFVGSWWDAAPAEASKLNLEEAFCVDNYQLQRLCIQVHPPVPYREVIPVMSVGRVNVMTQRPLFRYFKFLTSKYFEIFAADTIPLVMLDPDHAESVYGPAGRELALHGEIADKLLNALHQPRKYREIIQEVRRHLVKHHSYHHRVQELVAALQA